MTLQLRHLDVNDLIGSAGGDPWETNRTIQAGAPGEISDLADAFRAASNCTQETTDEFMAAQERFEAAWDRHDGGDHPINDSVEVRRASESMDYNRDAMARVAVDLANLAASLAEAQRSGTVSIASLESALQRIDNQIGYEISLAAANGETVDVSELRQAAVDRTATSLGEIQTVRDAYGEQLDSSRLEMAAEGYSPHSTNGVEGEGGMTPDEQARADADKYGAGQRIADERLVSSAGPWTAEKHSAAGRLRDYTTLNNPNADPASARYAGERLNDYHMSRFTGPLPIDPVLGRDARSRAQNRLALQQELEAGFDGMPPMGADAATEMLDSAEATGRALVLNRVESQLNDLGLSEAGVAQVVKNLGSGADMIGTGVERYGDSVPTGKHALDGLSKVDADLLAQWGGRIANVGNIAQLAAAGFEYSDGGENRNEQLGEAVGSVGGSMAGGAAAGAAVGSVAGPATAAIAAVIGGLVGGFAGADLGGGVGSMLDPVPAGSGGKSW